MTTTKADPVSIHYRRGFLLYGAWLALAVPAVLTLVFIAFTARSIREEPEIIMSLWALELVFTIGVAILVAPYIERFARADPAVTVSSEGIKTRDMETLLRWDEIERLTTRTRTSWAGRHTTTIHVLEIVPREAAPSSFSWRRLIDPYADPLRIAWAVLAGPERLRDALNLHAPPALLAKSNLAGLPDSRYSKNRERWS